MTVGFTGTQRGMTDEQREVIWKRLQEFGDVKAHHGMCIGADEEFHKMAERLGFFTHGHPGVRPGGQKFNRSSVKCMATEPESLYLERNRDIVKACDVLVAAPAEGERRRSGTWSTIRYARKLKRWHIIVWPDGAVSEVKP